MCFCFHTEELSAQTYSYNKTLKLDLPLSLGGGLGWMYSNRLKKRKVGLSEEEIGLLNIDDISKFDRVSCRNWSLGAHKASNVFLLSSYVLPYTLLLDKNIRGGDNLGNIALFTFETVAINSAVTGIIKELVRRKRPLLYNPNCPIEKKLHRDATSSFISGHTSNVAALSFMTAQMYSDLHPNSKGRGYVWGTAALIPAVTALLRVKAGRHFPTDVIAGYLVGAAVGILVPRLHRVRVE
ncbi:MAG: phosphatase PAP2 family protein [Chitinophagales bacterium]